MPEILQQIKSMSDEELEQLIVAARAQLEQRHEAPLLDESEESLLLERALQAKANGFRGRSGEEVLANLRRANQRDAQ